MSSNDPMPSARTGRGNPGPGRIRRAASFSLFELWQLRKLHIATGTQNTNIETVSVWGVVNGEPDCQEVKEMIEELKYHLAGGHPTLKVHRLWLLELDDRSFPFYAESDEEAEYHARQMERWGKPRLALVPAPQGYEDSSGVITIISYVAQRTTIFK